MGFTEHQALCAHEKLVRYNRGIGEFIRLLFLCDQINDGFVHVGQFLQYKDQIEDDEKRIQYMANFICCNGDSIDSIPKKTLQTRTDSTKKPCKPDNTPNKNRPDKKVYVKPQKVRQFTA